MEKRWKLRTPGDKNVVKKLANSLDIDLSLCNLLVQRGVNTFEEAREFFRPELKSLHDPFLMKDMDIAVERLERAIRNKEKILVYGDYDVDGTTAVALIYTFLKQFLTDIDFYLPDRYAEGYGISTQGIDYAKANNFTLIIALDCGIKSHDKMEYANQLGLEFIICDHHRPSDTLPKAYAILDPKRDDCSYPFKELSGCGVGFKLLQAFCIRNSIKFETLSVYLDLVVVSIASDIVPITGENRILAYYGLKRINSQPRIAFQTILSYSNVFPNKKINKNSELFFERELTINDLVFLIGPRINAAGRIENARNSVDLLITSDIEKSCTIAKQINEFNSTRREYDKETTEHALEIISSKPELVNRKSTVVYHPGWHKGVIGIVASRLTDHYYRPTIVLTKSNGLITGSARSVKDFDIYDAIDACSDLLEHFGGHKYAAGLALLPENLEAFFQKFEKVVADTIEEKLLTPEIEIDCILNIKDISPKFFRVLKQFAPFGPGNLSPYFQTDYVTDTGEGRIVGNNHLKLNIVCPVNNSIVYPAIAFGLGGHLEAISSKIPFSICYHIEENEWNGKVNLQLNVKDIKIY